MSGEFLPIQVKLFMRAKQKDVYLRTLFLRISTQHFLKIIGATRKKLLAFFKKLYFLILKCTLNHGLHGLTKGYPNEQMSLVIVETFKRQDNEEVAKLSSENNWVLIIVPHNLTNNFQPLDITFNKPAKSFIEAKYNIWYTEQDTKQLNKGKPPADVDVSLNLTQIWSNHYMLSGFLRYTNT